MKSVYTKQYEHFLRCLIDARKEAGVTQQTLAVRLRKPQSFVSKYERRERRLDVIEFVSVARAVGVDPCKILREIDSGGRKGEV